MPEDNFRIYRLHGEELTLAASGRISETIDAVLAAHFTGTQPVPQAGHAPLSEVVFYDAGNGKLSLYRGLPGTNLEHVKRHSMSSRWDILVAGNFKGGFANEIVLYDRQDGTSKFIQFTADGDIVELAKHDWTDRWDIIVAGRFGGFSQDDLLFYDRDSGRLKIQECRDAQLTELLIDTTIEPGWDVIVAGRFITSAVRTPLFFYRASTGQGRLYELGFDGQFKAVKNFSDLPKHRDVCVAGDVVTRGAPDQALLYDRDTGAATVYAFLHPNQALESVMEFELPRHVHAVVPCNLVEAAPGRDLIMAGVHNAAVYLGWGAYLDLAINFNEFFDADHTVMCWFMPQFVHANYQPVIAENGSGTYIVGLAAYGSGNVVFNKDAGEEFNKAGDPVLYVKIGNAERIYLAPEAGDGTWIHLALVRRGNRFSLFLNGILKKPVTITTVKETVEDDDGNDVDVTKDKVVESDTELEVPGATFDRKPSGTLRIGRRTTGTSDSKLMWQAYGLVDDIAVFTQALTAARLQNIIGSRRLAVTDDMLACWPLDFPASGAGSSPSKFRTYTRSTRPGPMFNVQPIPVPVIVPVSAGRSSDYDSGCSPIPA